VSAQNHDQIGNRPNGERLTSLVGPERQRLAAALVLLSPYVPLLFMGEEYGETAPFLYFIEHGDADLIEAVRAGRKREFDAIGKHEAQVDPQAEETFLRSKLDWSKREGEAGSRLMSLYCDLLALRRDEPALKPGDSETHVQGAAEWFTALRVLPLRNDLYDPVRSRRALFCAFNLSDETMNIPVRPEAIGSWRLRLTTDAVAYGGSGAVIDNIAPERTPEISDAPKRLLERRNQLSVQLRGVRLPAWSAAVFERDFLNDGAQG
jgi:maltooligosyltrehalose trehalohydrolase